MHFENADLQCSFDLPEPFTLGNHNTWVSAREKAEKAGALSIVAVNWIGAATILQNWECSTFPDISQGWESLTADKFAIVNWAGSAVNAYITSLFIVPKATSSPQPSE